MAGLSLRCCPQPLNHLAWGIKRYQQDCGWPWSNITIYHLLFFRFTPCIPSAVPILAKIPIFYNRCTFSEFPPSFADSVSLMNVPHSSSRSPVIFSFYLKSTIYLSCIKHQSWYSACATLLSSISMHCYVGGKYTTKSLLILHQCERMPWQHVPPMSICYLSHTILMPLSMPRWMCMHTHTQRCAGVPLIWWINAPACTQVFARCAWRCQRLLKSRCKLQKAWCLRPSSFFSCLFPFRATAFRRCKVIYSVRVL